MQDQLTEFEPIVDEKEDSLSDSVTLSVTVIFIFVAVTFCYFLFLG